jgi:hypothetical protein
MGYGSDAYLEVSKHNCAIMASDASRNMAGFTSKGASKHEIESQIFFSSTKDSTTLPTKALGIPNPIEAMQHKWEPH